jgi:hypothetical protein
MAQERDKIGLPPRIFMYTPDQIATMLELDLTYVKKTLLFYDKREPGLAPKTKMRSINIAPEGETPEWRVTERELIRYLRNRGLRFYERGFGL